MPKILFIKKTKITGTGMRSYWYTSLDGTLVEDTLSYDEKEAALAYKCVCDNAGKHDLEEVIESRFFVTPESTKKPL